MTPLRVAIIGAGKMGAHHARVFGARAVYDVDAGATERVARAVGARVASSFEDAIANAELVVIATPTALHFDHAARALAAGKHVLVEKPLAKTAAEAWELCAIARAHRVKLFAGHSERFNPVVRELVRACAGETIASIITHRTAAAEADDLCLNLAVHDVDLVALLAGAPATLVSASGARDEAVITLRAGSAIAEVHVSRAPEKVRSIRVQTARISRDGNLVHATGAEPLALQAASALAAIDGKPSAIATGDDGARAVALAEAASTRIAETRHFAAE